MCEIVFPSKIIEDCLETFGRIKIFRIIKKFQDHPKIIQTIKKLSGLSRNFPGYLETVWAIWKISRLYRNFPGHPDTPDYPKTFQLSGNFPDNPENI